VAVRVSTPLGDIATLAILGTGSFVGELALLSPTARRTATVAALEASETLSLHRDAFEEIRRQHPGVIQVVIAGLVAQVERLSSQVTEALYVPADRCVLRRLLELVREYGELVPLTQEELAGLAGTTRPTVNRVLRECEDQGLLILARGRSRFSTPPASVAAPASWPAPMRSSDLDPGRLRPHRPGDDRCPQGSAR